ncbi:MAG: choice-of-anchor P family protein [Actinomycetes bacterium]
MPVKRVRAKRIRALVVICTVVAATAGRASVLDPVRADSSIGAFEIDGNRPDDSGGSGDPVDWDSVATGTPPVVVTSFTDDFGHGKEDGFGGNSKNLAPANWACDDVQTPDKDDIKSGAVGFRTFNGEQFLYFNFERVGNNGTADLDVEFNQALSAATHPSASCEAAGLAPRSDGDLVIAFDQMGQTSTAADVHLYEWQGNATTGQLVEIPTAGLFQGQLDANRTFAEAALNLSRALGRSIECGEFSTVFMKSRAAASINSDLKDRTDPAPVVSSGTSIGFSVTVTNNGPGTAKGVTLTDPLPGGAGIDWSESPDTTACSITGSPQTETLNCSFGDLAAGQSVTVHVSSPTTGATSGTFTYTATAQATNAPPATGSDSVRVDKPSITITKRADATTVDAGSPIGFTVTVRSNGPGTAAAVTLNDPLPAGTGIDWSEDPDSPFCEISGTPPDETLVCGFGDLAPGQERTVHVSSPTTSATSGTFSNTAVASSSNHPPVTSDTPTVTVNKPALVATKTADAPSTTAGTPIGFTVSVTNDGPGTATAVMVNDPLPGGTGIDWSESPDNPQCQITGAPPAQTLTCNFGDLAPGQTRTVHVVSQTTGSTSGTFTNRATVTSTNAPTQEPSATTTVVAPNLAITKVADASSVSSGSPIGFTVTVTSNGPGTALGVTLVDPLPSGTGLDWSESPDTAACTITGEPPNEVLTCDWGDLAPGQTRTVHVTSPTTAATAGTVTNTATVRAANHPDRSATASTAVLRPSLSVLKTADNATVDAGSPIQFTITVRNDGPGTATNVLVNDPLPSGAGIDWSTVSPGCSVQGTPPNETLVCDLGSMAPGVRTIYVTSGTTAATSGSFENTVTVSSGNHPDVMSTATVTVNRPNVSVVKTADAGTVSAGGGIGYSVTVTNAGPGTAKGVTLTDPLPGGTGVNWAESPDLPQCEITGTAPNQTLGCNFGDLAPGSVTVHVVSATTTASCGTLTNVATVRGSNISGTISSAPATITIECRAVLTIGKTACPSVAVPGGVLTYTITFGNAGTGTATGVVVTDTVPDGTTVVDAGGGTVDGGTIAWNVGSLGPNQSQTRTVKVLVHAGNGATLSNTATVSAANADPASTGAVLTPVSNAGATTTGRAYAADANVLQLDLIKKLKLVSTEAPPSPDSEQAQLASLTLPGLVELGLITDTSKSEIGNDARSTAAAQVAGVNLLGGAIRADLVRGQSTSKADANFATGSSAGSSFTNLRIFGVNNGNPITNVAPNTTVDVKNPLLPKQTLARAVLLEESKTAAFTNGKFTATHQVNMIHVTLVQPFLTLPKGTEIVVAHADTTASFPSGLACGARPGLVSGDAYNAWVNGTIAGQQFANVQVGDARITPLGGSDSDGVAANIPGVVTNATVANTASGSIAGDPSATARSRAENVNVLSALRPGGLVTADAIDVRSTSTTTASTATTAFQTTFVNLRVAGIAVGATVSPNATIVVNVAGLTAVVVLNEQTSVNGTKDTFGTVNAIHVYLYDAAGLLTAEVIVGHAHSDAHHP